MAGVKLGGRGMVIFVSANDARTVVFRVISSRKEYGHRVLGGCGSPPFAAVSKVATVLGSMGTFTPTSICAVVVKYRNVK